MYLICITRRIPQGFWGDVAGDDIILSLRHNICHLFEPKKARKRSIVSNTGKIYVYNICLYILLRPDTI